MRDLRLIGVHDDGEHLVVADSDGEEYRIVIDEQLRAAARRDRPRLGQLQIEMDSTVRPREVQAMIRAGATAEEVAARTGWSLEKIARFEGPVLAEREHVAQAAQRVRLRGQGTGSVESLGGRATRRLDSRGVAPEAVAWDAARDADGQWTVTAAFAAGGKDRQATWWFDTAGMSVVAKNDEARWLSEADSPEGVVPTPHRPTSVFDVEAEEARSTQRDSDELMRTMREHARGRRRGRRRTSHVEPPLPLEDAAEALPETAPVEAAADPGAAAADEAPAAPSPTATELPPGAKGTHPLDEPGAAKDAGEDTTSDAAPEGPDEPGTEARSEPEADRPEPTEAPEPKEEPADDAQPVKDSEPAKDDGPADDAVSEDDSQKEPRPARPAAEKPAPSTPSEPRRKGRASVPSWDDVMFGAKRGERGRS